MSGADVVIVVAPFGQADTPALAASTLKARCSAEGLRTTVYYSNLELAARVGSERYQRVAMAFDEALVGERVFRAAAFPAHYGDLDPVQFATDFEQARDPFTSARELKRRLLKTGTFVAREDVAACVREVDAFLTTTADWVVASGAKIVGFSSVFQQTLASIAIARKLKETQPHLVTVLGGANTNGPMGLALADTTEVFDFVFSGEADLTFPDFCSQLLEHRSKPAQRLVTCPPLYDLDQTCGPDYNDYFDQLATLVAQQRLPASLQPPHLHFEASRGCWWGERHRCTFCGLSGSEVRYRRKSPKKVIDELQALSSRHDVKLLCAVDNIIFPREERAGLLSALADASGDYELFWEIRPDISDHELDAFVKIGLRRLQSGIESFSTHLLRRLGKGTTGARNIAFLRDCASRGIRCVWNLLLAIPGETAADYRAMMPLFVSLEHLQPPRSVCPVRIDRFSPLHQSPQDFGLTDLQPLPIYRDLFPERAALDDLANHFVAGYTTELTKDEGLQLQLAERLLTWIVAWRDAEEPPMLGAVELEDGLVLIKDTRSCASETFHLVPQEVLTCLHKLERPRKWPVLDPESRPLIGELLQRRFIVEHEDYLVSVVTRPSLAMDLRGAAPTNELE